MTLLVESSDRKNVPEVSYNLSVMTLNPTGSTTTELLLNQQPGWLRDTVVERRSLTGQPGRLSLSSFRSR